MNGHVHWKLQQAFHKNKHHLGETKLQTYIQVEKDYFCVIT